MIDTNLITFVYRLPLVWAELILWGQFFLCKFAFIADKDGKFVSITNRYIINLILLAQNITKSTILQNAMLHYQ